MPRVVGYDISIAGEILHGPYTILDGQAVAQPLVNFTAASSKFIELTYSVERNGSMRTGVAMISSNGVTAALGEINTELSELGVVLDATISGANVQLTYTSTSTGFNASFKYYAKIWT